MIAILCIPCVLTIMNLYGLFWPEVKWKKRIWIVTLILGVLCNILLDNTLVSFQSGDRHWSESVLVGNLHQVLCYGYRDVYKVVFVVAVIGVLILLKSKPGKTPPLVTVLAIAALYPEIVTGVVFIIHVMPGLGSKNDTIGAFWILFPINLIVIAFSLIRDKIREYEEWQMKEQAPGEKVWYERVLSKSRTWPFLALLFALPILGMILGIAVLFGQKPDAFIKAWTETADWNLSTKIPPQDHPQTGGHYLCTVAAGGHKKVVKPIRMGERRGHRVVVNRQLEIANAFEMVLEEKTPGFHKAVRGFYDRFGLPIANCIRAKGVCDIVYVLMKPLEWIFLIIIYLTQSHPEDLIAIQYMPGYREFWQDFKKEREI